MIIRTKFKNLVIYKNIKHHDKRGYVKELFKENIIKKKFPFIIMSYSKKNILRGMHIQTRNPQGKFVSVLKGKIFDIAIDLRRNSKTFGNYFSCILSETNSQSVYIPPGFAHGFLTLGKENYVVYNCTKHRSKKNEVAIKFNDKSLKIKWPSKKPIISKKDAHAISFIDFKKKYT